MAHRSLPPVMVTTHAKTRVYGYLFAQTETVLVLLNNCPVDLEPDTPVTDCDRFVEEETDVYLLPASSVARMEYVKTEYVKIKRVVVS